MVSRATLAERSPTSIAGFALLWLIPELRYLKLSGGVDGIKTTGIAPVPWIIFVDRGTLRALESVAFKLLSS
jgi:hypothetical protein